MRSLRGQICDIPETPSMAQGAQGVWSWTPLEYQLDHRGPDLGGQVVLPLYSLDTSEYQEVMGD